MRKKIYFVLEIIFEISFFILMGLLVAFLIKRF